MGELKKMLKKVTFVETIASCSEFRSVTLQNVDRIKENVGVLVQSSFSFASSGCV